METLNDLIENSTEPINIFKYAGTDAVTVIATNGWTQEKLKNTCNLLNPTYPGELDINYTEAYDEVFMAVSASGECGAFLCQQAGIIQTWFNKKMEVSA